MSEFVNERNWEWEGSNVYFKHADGERELRFRKAGSRIRGADSGLYSARAYRAGEALGYYCGSCDAERWKVGGREAEDRRIEVLGTNAGRYVVELAGWYLMVRTWYVRRHAQESGWTTERRGGRARECAMLG